MDSDKEKSKEETNNTNEKKRIAPDEIKEKHTSLAKRSGQRPALPFKRKRPA